MSTENPSQEDKHITLSRLPFMGYGIGKGLFLAAVVLNLFVAGLGGVALQYFHESSTRQAEIQSQNVAQALEQNLGESIAKIDITLRTVANELERQLAAGGVNASSVQKLVEQQKAMLPELEAVSVTDEEGNLVMHSGSAGVPRINIADRAYFTTLKNGTASGLVFSKPVHSRIDQTMIVLFNRGYKYADGRFAGVVSIPVSLSYLTKLLSGFEVGPQGIMTLRDADFGLIALYPPALPNSSISVGDTSVTQELRDLVTAGRARGTFHATTPFDNVARTLSFHRVPNAPILVVAGLGEEDYLAEWYRLVKLAAVIYGLFAAATSFSAWLVYRFWQRQANDAEALRMSNTHLAESQQVAEERLRFILTLLRALPELIWLKDTDGVYLMCNPRFERFFGVKEVDIVGKTDYDFVDRELADLFRAYDMKVIKSGEPSVNEEWVTYADDGHRELLETVKTPLFDAQGKLIGVLGTARDITRRKHAEERLLLTHEAFLHSSEAVVITDAEGIIQEVNPAFTVITGYTHEDVVGKRPSLLKSGLQEEGFYQRMWSELLREGFWKGEFQNRRKDGSLYTQFVRISAVRDPQGAINRFIGLASDVTELRESQSRMEYLAYHDKLTDLPNRVMLADRLGLAVSQAMRRAELLGVCYLDLDGFKPINDSWGHDVGDQLLIEVAQRLLSCVRAGDTVARMGGDEFVVLLGGIKQEREIELAVQRMLAAISSPFYLGDVEALITMSVGVTIFPHDAEDTDALLRHADQAMYIAKRTGKNCMHMFDPEGDRRLKAHHDLFSRVVAALVQEEFCLYYQPKVDMRSGTVVGVEALIRWRHPERGVVAPAEFLPAVENTEFSIQLGEWVIREALRQMDEWQAAGVLLPVSVNISGYHLQRKDFVTRLAALLAEAPNVAPQHLELEILETSAVEDVDAVAKLIAECTALGVSFALDDFGTGYSSLTYFRRLPTHLLKIDQSFVRDMLVDPNDCALVESIVRLARSFQRKVIAEGVETIEHGIPLLQFGCDLAQGYGIARPMPAQQVLPWVQEWQVPAAWKNAIALQGMQ